jgi:hypothetical protein
LGWSFPANVWSSPQAPRFNPKDRLGKKSSWPVAILARMGTRPEDGVEARGSPTPPRSLAIAISVTALVVAGVHLIWPELHIDAVTLALVVVAIAPWLAPIFKSIELPGGLRFEYQQIERQVREVQRRVESVERLVFTGDTTPKLENELGAAVQRFASYLRGVNESLAVPPPTVRVRRGLENAQYDNQEIQLDPEFAEDDYSVMREYAHHVLMTVHGSPEWSVASGYAGLESGVADYLVASYTESPELGPGLARRFKEKYGEAFDRPYVRNLRNERRLDSPDTYGPQAEGEVWGAALWELRQLLGQGDTDRLVTTAWIDADQTAVGLAPAAFSAMLLRLIDDGHRNNARQAFDSRGLPVSAS